MAEQQATTLAATGAMAQAIAARLAAHGYRSSFPSGRLQGNRPARRTRRGSNRRRRRQHRLPLHRADPGGGSQGHHPASGARPPQIQAVTSRMPVATWNGIEVEALPAPRRQPADPAQTTTALLAHLAVLDGRHDGKDA